MGAHALDAARDIETVALVRSRTRQRLGFDEKACENLFRADDLEAFALDS